MLGGLPIDEDTNEQESSEEILKLKEELRMMGNNFQRLQAILNESLEETNTVKSEYEAKLIDVNEKLRVTKAENEELKERVDVLFKLGRGYINKNENNRIVKAKTSHPTNNHDVILVEETEDNIENTEENPSIDDLNTWTKNKLRGFKRAAPGAAPEPNSAAKTPSNSPPKSPPPPPPSRTSTSPQSSEANTRSHEVMRTQGGRIMYCHYYSNYGKCLFEEKTGQTCKFAHKNAPICQNGTSCTRNKCMFKHPNTPGRNSFLSPGPTFPMNPWQMINPFLNTNQSQYQYPAMWNTNFQNMGIQTRN